MSTLSIAAICHLYEERGNRVHQDEPVSLLQHALQAAWLAEQEQAEPALIAAAFLHDIGHLMHAQADRIIAGDGIDDRHEQRAAENLSELFGPDVIEPIRLHVDAKRYLCRIRPDYAATLSAGATRALVLQGGVFSDGAAAAFAARAHADRAVRLRLWDDQAKVPGLATPSLAHFAVSLRLCVRRKV